MAGNIKVGVRLRPMIAREENESLRWKVQGQRISRFDADTNRLYNPMEFDHVFGDEVKNVDIFKTLVEPMVQNAVKGFNATILAYGQTSSGKTHTMIGNETDGGIVPLTMENIFTAIENLDEDRNFLLGVSFMEVYNEKVRDLLNIEKSELKVYETQEGNISTDCSLEMVNCADQMVHLLNQGNKNKSIGETQMNDRSSRSHTIFRITIESQGQGADLDGVARVSQINLVDLAGSERASQTGTTGQRYKEGCAINKSLLQLGNVVQKLSEDKGEFIDYRSSKLTRILQPSLSGNANIVMICNVTPYSADQTANTLLFASRASTIKLAPHLNELMDDATLLKRHAKRIKELEKDMKDASVLKEKNQHLEREVEKLRNMLVVSRLSTLQLEKQRALRRRTWGGPALERPTDVCKDLGLHSANLEVIQLLPLRDVKITVPEIDRKASLPESVTVRNDDFNVSVCMSIDEFEEPPSFLITPSIEATPPSKLRSEIINLRQQLAEKAAATPVLRQQITILEKNLEEKDKETVGTPKSTLRTKINQLEEERTELQPTTPVPKLRERIRTLEEELENEHTKNQTEQIKIMETLHKIEAELQTKSDALQLKTKDFEQLLKERAVDAVEMPGTPAAVLHDRIKQLQERSSQLSGTPPAQLRKKIHNLEAECKHVEEELNELREFTTLEKQMIEEGKLEELHRELHSLKKTLEDYEQMCCDLRKHNSDLSVQNENLSEVVNELQNSVQALTKELETNKVWNSKANEQQLIWKKELNQCKEKITEMSNKSKDWVDEKELLKCRYESKIKELTASLEEAWASDSQTPRKLSVSAQSVESEQQLEKIQELQQKVDQLQISLDESESKILAVKQLSCSSCQTDHDAEGFGHQEEIIRELREKLDTAEEELVALKQKTTLEIGSQTEHDDEHPSENIMAEFESLMDEKNKLMEQLEAVADEKEELQQSMKCIMFEHEGLQAEVDDLKQNAANDKEKVNELLLELKFKSEETESLATKLKEINKALETLTIEKENFLSLQKQMSDKISQLESSVDSQQEIKERMFFVSQESDNLKTQLEYKQESINFNMSEIERLKSELCHAKASAIPQKTIFIKEEPKETVQALSNLAELTNQRDALEELKNQLEIRVLELESVVASYEKTIGEMKTAQQQTEVYEFQHDSLTVMPSNEVEEELRKQIAELKQQVEGTKHVDALEQQRNDLSMANHDLEDQLSETLEQIKEQGLLSELACQVTSASPHIESYISEQLEQIQTKNDELEAANGTLKAQLDALKHKCGALIVIVEEMNVVRDDVQSFTDLLIVQIQEVSGQKAQSVNLKDLHKELLDAFMLKSQQVCSGLNLQLESLEEKMASYKKKAHEQAAIIQSLEDANKQLRNTAPQAESEIEEYKTKVATLELELEENRKLLDEMQSKLEENQDDSMVTMSGKELGLALQLNETKDCLEMAITEEKQMRVKLAEKEEELSAALEQQTILSNQLAEIVSEEQGVRHILDETMKIAETTKEQCAELQNELAYSKEKISELEHAIDVTEKSSEGDKEKLLKLKADLADYKKKLAESEDLEVKTSEQLMDRLAEMETLTKRDAELQKKITELESANVDSEELRREAAAKTKELEAAVSEIERLRASLSVVDERLAEIPSLTSTIQELQQQKAAELQELYEKLAETEIFKSEAIEAEILRRNLADLEECKAKNAEELNLQLAEIDELNKKLQETENLKNLFENDLQELRASSKDTEELQLRLKEADELAATVSELESALDEAKKDINARKVYAEKLEEELACSKAARNFLDRSANTTADMHLTLDNKSMDQILSLESVNLNLRSEVQKLTDEYDTLSSEKSSLEERVTQLETEVGDFKEKSATLKNQVALLTAKEIKNLELASNLRSEIVHLKESIDKLELELETSNESLQKEQALAKKSLSSAELEEKHFQQRQELFALSDKLAATEKKLHQAQNDNDNLQQICDKKSAELAEIESRRSLLSSEQASCWQELLEARQNYDQMAVEKADLVKNLDMYKCNMEQMRASMNSAGSDMKVQLQELKDDAIRMNNEKYEVELQLQEKMELIAEFESKITHTNTILNRISGERDVLSIRLQEAKVSLEEVTAQRDELSEKCKETDSEYEELLAVYREVEGKSKTFQTQSIKLRQENDELILKLKNLDSEVSSTNAIDHSKCLLQVKEMEKLAEEKNRDMMALKRELSNVRGEFMHLKFRISNEPGMFDESEEHKQKIKEAEHKIALLRDEIKSLTSKLHDAEKMQTRSKSSCSRCLRTPFLNEAGTQAVVSTSSVSVQAPPDNDALFDSVQGYTPFSAITEAARMYGMKQQIEEMQVKIGELTSDRKLFKDVLRKRLATIRSLELQLNAKDNPGQENKGIPLTDKN